MFLAKSLLPHAVLGILLFAAPACTRAEGPEWLKEKQAGTVVFFSRTPHGSRVKEFKAVTEISAPIDKVWTVLRDVPRYPDWFGDCVKAEEMTRFSENRVQYFLLMKTAGPLKNREIYAEVVYTDSSSGGKREFLMKDAAGLPRKPYKTSRPVKTVYGSCGLSVSEAGKTKVEYSILIDPGEEIPAGLSNLFVLGQFEKIMAGLKKISER